MPLVQIFILRFNLYKIISESSLLGLFCLFELISVPEFNLKYISLFLHLINLIANISQLSSRFVESNSEFTENFIGHPN
jgi:hypothetical protein